MRLYDLFKQDPAAALNTVLDEAEQTYRKNKLLWTSCNGTDGQLYGSYKPINRKLLEGREYRVEYWDGMVALHFTDVVYDCCSHSIRPLNDFIQAKGN